MIGSRFELAGNVIRAYELMNSRGLAVQLGHRGGPNSSENEEERPFYSLIFHPVPFRREEARRSFAHNSRKNRVRDFNESSPRIASSVIPQTVRISSYPIPSVASRRSGIGEPRAASFERSTISKSVVSPLFSSRTARSSRNSPNNRPMLLQIHTRLHSRRVLTRIYSHFARP